MSMFNNASKGGKMQNAMENGETRREVRVVRPSSSRSIARLNLNYPCSQHFLTTIADILRGAAVEATANATVPRHNAAALLSQFWVRE
jgi:hypothetical protein